ncbi:MAG: apolipoprotein N-acyltransferase [Candidatus Delongbacteria bacterium]|nr:apolipoprotein N-acyltransferase [Candidatus Delongbacteria bacterium]MBN2833638.1 apolipoprotein N-acyltransferase [Candidatus Delongbacteria bacterium]
MSNQNKKVLLIVFSAVLFGYSSITMNSYIIWISFVPLLLAIDEKKIRSNIILIAIFSLVFGSIAYAWIPVTFERFTGSFSFISLIGIAFLILINFIQFFIWITAIQKFKIANQSFVRTMLLNTIFVASVYFILEWINCNLFIGIPWNKIMLRNAIASNVYFIQSASIVGSVGLSFIIIAANYLIFISLKTKRLLPLWLALGVFLLNFLYGLYIFQQDPEKDDKKNVALICENVKAETKWTEQGDQIISKMLGLVNDVKSSQPYLIVWPESALPWTYVENDDILLAIADILKGCNTQNLIGYLSQSEFNKNLVYNSAYLIDENGKSIGRYDKRILLDFIEKPFMNKSGIQFFSMFVQSIYDNVQKGNSNILLSTNLGKAKIEICNESLVSDYFNTNDISFDFIVNISNDSWLENTQNIKHHFYLSALKSIEYRKYTIINSNRGISGIIDDKGRVQISKQSDKPEKVLGYIVSNQKQTIFARFPLLIPILSILVLITMIIINYITRIKMRNQN